jgi:hypothetical protein
VAPRFVALGLAWDVSRSWRPPFSNQADLHFVSDFIELPLVAYVTLRKVLRHAIEWSRACARRGKGAYKCADGSMDPCMACSAPFVSCFDVTCVVRRVRESAGLVTMKCSSPGPGFMSGPLQWALDCLLDQLSFKLYSNASR